MTLDEIKTTARKEAFARRKLAHGAGGDEAAQAHLREVLAPYQGKAIAGYMPIRTEISPLPVMAELAAQGPVGVPVILGIEGAFGAMVPEDGVEVVPDVLIVPLVAFDRAGNRLGYGGGFYDRTLEKLRAARPTIAIGYAYGAQEADSLPLEPTDQPLDAIVTEAEVLRF
ncbi:MAG: 5-formyltetrahydrofolate cyclo-ligase [Maritimibacter sp.]